MKFVNPRHWFKVAYAHRKRIRLVPSQRGSPAFRQRLGNSHQDETNVQQRDRRGEDHHRVPAVHVTQIRPDRRAGDETRRESRRHLCDKGTCQVNESARGQRPDDGIRTKPYAELRFSSSVISATYANTIDHVTANAPLIEIMAKNHLERE